MTSVNSSFVMFCFVFGFFLVVFVCFFSLSCAGGGLSDACVIMGVVGFLVFGFPSSNFCKAEFVAMYY